MSPRSKPLRFAERRATRSSGRETHSQSPEQMGAPAEQESPNPYIKVAKKTTGHWL